MWGSMPVPGLRPLRNRWRTAEEAVTPSGAFGQSRGLGGLSSAVASSAVASSTLERSRFFDWPTFCFGCMG